MNNEKLEKIIDTSEKPGKESGDKIEKKSFTPSQPDQSPKVKAPPPPPGKGSDDKGK